MVTKIREISTSYRLPLRLLVAVLIVGSLVALWYYAFQMPFRKLVSPMVAFNAADIGDYEKDVALAFFGSIDSPKHKNCRFYRDRFPIKRDRDGTIDIAVTIAVYNDIRPVARIMRMIHRTNNYYCIHLNRNADQALQAAMKGLITCFDNNVELVPTNSSVALIRSGEGVLKAHLACAEQALRRNGKWKYLINIDDDEFPLRTNLEIVSILQALNGANLVESFSTPSRDSLVGNKSLPLEATWYRGSLHGAYRREFLENALFGQAVAPLREYLLEHDALLHSEELFFPILAYNAKLNLPGACQKAPSPAEEVNFGFLADLNIREDYGVRCITKYVDHVCLLGNEHLQMLKSALHLYASKFQPDYEPDAYTTLEQWYFDRVKAEMKAEMKSHPTFDTYIYSTLTCSRQHV